MLVDHYHTDPRADEPGSCSQCKPGVMYVEDLPTTLTVGGISVYAVPVIRAEFKSIIAREKEFSGPAGLDRVLPRYRSHKEVSALRITAVRFHADADRVVLSTKFGTRMLAVEAVARYTPVPGDYLVIYDDGYESISPRKAFEEGYSSVDNTGDR